MRGFIEWLDDVNRNDSKARALLRRSLAFAPGSYPPAFPFVEPFVRDEDGPWTRAVYYLVGGLWALHWRDGIRGRPLSIGVACADYQQKSGSASVERRFISLLDADRDQLPYRLRQLISLLGDYPIDFDALQKGLIAWESHDRRPQNEWARDFYRNIGTEGYFENEKEERP